MDNLQYLIDVPPPTISGNLHIGHVFSYCHMDFIARYQRKRGNKILYPFCFDNNGLPTERYALSNAITDSKKILEFSVKSSMNYQFMFQKAGIASSYHYYHTFNEFAIDLVNKSFKDLVKQGLCYKTKAEYFYCPVSKISVSQAEIDSEGRFERSGVKAEIRKGEGWFINIKHRLKEIRDKIDQIKWHPDHFRHRLHRWLDDLKYDWSISRTRQFGIPIPGDPEFVFDTWFTSSLTPQMAWASHTMDRNLECPVFDVRFQGHDIIRTWALYTIVKSLYHNNQIPWKNIVISGHCIDANGKKMSKSKGNVVDPKELIKDYGYKAVRYWAAQNNLGTDTKINLEVIKKGNKLINKIINAKRFIDKNKDKRGENLSFYQEWKMKEVELIKFMDNFNWPACIQNLQDFFWNNFCSTQIEKCKESHCIDTIHKIFYEAVEWWEIFLPGIRFDVYESTKEGLVKIKL